MEWATTMVLGILAILWIGLESASGAPMKEANSGRDVHSLGNPEVVKLVHVDLDLTVHFERKELEGAAVLRIERQPGAGTDVPLMLDTRGLTIVRVGIRDGNEGAFADAKFEMGPADPVLGSRLKIPIGPATREVRVDYRTTPSAGALQWLDPSLTAGKGHPFLFTQSEAIHARSWIPLQDSPGVRISYSAVIRVPKGLVALMAADDHSSVEEAREGIYRFKMEQPIPSYLVAMAAGDLAFRKIGPSTGVWAEPSVVEKAAYEFADVEGMVNSIQNRFGPYRWGRYDILVLPPSFPFGGMENPKLTFATPTVLAGDRSLVSLIAHELAHSWSGNLVTNATWRDFWLNEGFTTYLERRVVEDLYGVERADMEWVLGLADLREDLKEKSPGDQALHINLDGRDPDEGMNRIPYEKGALFLRTIETTVGRDRFDDFLRDYFAHFAFRSITTGEFVGYLRGQPIAHDPAFQRLDMTTWLEGPGLPSGYVEPSSKRLEAIGRTAQGWVDGTIPTDQIDAKNWTTHEWIQFLQAMPEKLSTNRLTVLDRRFGLTDRGNAEIAHQWLLIAIRNQYAPANERLKMYLTTIGRRKLVLPLYRAMLATPAGRQQAEAIYAVARPGYHPITVDSVDRLMKSSK